MQYVPEITGYDLEGNPEYRWVVENIPTGSSPADLAFNTAELAQLYDIELRKLGLGHRELDINERQFAQDIALARAKHKLDELELGRRYGLDVRQFDLDAEISRGQLALDTEELAEMVRSNKVREAQEERGLALSSAVNAMDAYLRATEMADARRLSAFQEARSLLPSLVPEGQKYFSGFEPTGPLATAFAGINLPFSPVEIVHKKFRPGELAQQPDVGAGAFPGMLGPIQAAGVQSPPLPVGGLQG